MRRIRPRKRVEPVVPKELLARQVAALMNARRLSQTAAARLTDDSPSQLSLVVGEKLRGFSVERLCRMLTRLGMDVEIRVRHRLRGPGRVRVVRG